MWWGNKNEYIHTEQTQTIQQIGGGVGSNILEQSYGMINKTYVSSANLLPIWVNIPE